ncbi:hypothetical protein J4558_11190 [Leptolyngbya sp. 15MV]|nr:hypothetical protein J4558_11190 [Leptolyngbya sp. 15MV]
MLADAHAAHVLLVEALPVAQVDQPLREALLFLDVDHACRRELDERRAQFVDGGGAIVDDALDRGGRGDREERRRGTERRAVGIDPDARDPLLLADADRRGGAFQHHHDFVLLARALALRIEDRAEQQQFGAGEALAHLNLALRHLGHEDRIALRRQHQQRDKEEQPLHSCTTVKISSGR